MNDLADRGPDLLFASVLWLLAPLGFIALPVSRRRAKVRWWHIFRITCYAGTFFVAILMGATYGMVRNLGGESGQAFSFLIRWVLPQVLLAWWGFATARYLRMDHPWGVAASALVIAWILAEAGRTLLQFRMGLL